MFQGFEPVDFAIMGIEGFAERMQAIRERLRPKLEAIGQAFAPRFSAEVGEALYPHVAMHARRRVHPPDDTWVAFSPSPRSYKSFAHYAVGATVKGPYVHLVLKDEAARERAALGRALADSSALKLRRLSPMVSWHNVPGHDAPVVGPAMRPEDFERLAAALRERKAFTMAVGRSWPARMHMIQDPEDFEEAAVDVVRELLPIYRLAAGPRLSVTA